MKYDIWAFFGKSVEELRDLLKSAKNNGYYTLKPIYIFDRISLSYSQNEKYFRHNNNNNNYNYYYYY